MAGISGSKNSGIAMEKTGTVKILMKSGKTYGNTEVTEKHSVSSKKKTVRQRHREAKNRLVGRG